MLNISAPTITKQDLPVNFSSDSEKEKCDEISLDLDDLIYTFTTIPNNLIRDDSISPNCRWLIIFLLSNKPGWTIKTKQLCNHTKGFIGRDGIRKVMNEAMEAGYMERTIILHSTPRGKLKGYHYKVASTPKFKKYLRQPEIQGPGNQVPEDQCAENQLTEDTSTKEVLSLRNTILKKDTSLKVSPESESAKAGAAEAAVAAKAADPIFKKPKPSKKDEPAVFSPDVLITGDKMFGQLKAIKPDFREPKLIPFFTHVDFMMRLDKRDPQKILDVFQWALTDHFWCDKMFRPNPAEYLRKKFDALEMQMLAKPPKKERKFAPCSDDKKALAIMQQMDKRAL